MIARVDYDNSFDVLATVVRGELGEEALRQGVVLREAAGRLAFFVDAELSAGQRERLAAALRLRLGQYARLDRVLAARGAPGVAHILEALTSPASSDSYLDTTARGTLTTPSSSARCG